MRRQPPIVRCFVLLCFSAGVTLAAFEWRSPFPDPVITPSTAPHITADAVLDLEDKGSQGKQVAFDLASPSQNSPGQNSPGQNSSEQSSQQRWFHLTRWLPFGQKEQTDAQTKEAPVELVLSLKSRLLEVRVPGKTPVLYEVAVGQDDWQTPTGEFSVINKLENPAWQHPITKETIAAGPDNPLGTHWIGFWSDGQAQIGFHGTNQEDLIGEAVSHGCVRMRNKDVQALYKEVVIGTSVKVQP